MAKLNQIIALSNGTKNRVGKKVTELYHKLKKSDLFYGISRKYEPADEEGEALPAEGRRVQFTAKSAIAEARRALVEMMDVVATQDYSNVEARADVVVDDNTLLSGVPVTHLLYLEKQLQDIGTFINHLPTLPEDEEWKLDENTGLYTTTEIESNRTKKVPKSHVLYEATKEHPAQVEMYHEDVTVGKWKTKKFAGSVPASEKRSMLERVEKLQDAVKVAREEANEREVTKQRVGDTIFDFVLGK